ncbi:AAA family ATPase [Streptomyces prasinus]|uniref:AAA family ATPase n=1 Tax=Streptomyces prasinus TaxID=67345 RepID=UPI0036ACB98E
MAEGDRPAAPGAAPAHLLRPPGTGKTYLTRALAKHLAGPDRVELVQFHPSYTYEDFFEGFRPVRTDNGMVAFEVLPGPLKLLAERARKDPANPHTLIIDEINRVNLAKFFGELYFLLEYREVKFPQGRLGSSASATYGAAVHRCGSHGVRTTFSQRSFLFLNRS